MLCMESIFYSPLLPSYLMKQILPMLAVFFLSLLPVFGSVTLAEFNTCGTFEGASENGVPSGWELVISSPKVNLVPAISMDIPQAGTKCLKLTCSYPNEPQVYGLMRTDITCQPMTEYKFTIYVKSESNNGSCWFGGGNQWRWYNGIPMGKYDWTPMDGYYRTGADETSFPFFVLASGNATIYVDSLHVTRMGPASDPTFRPSYQTWDASRLQSVFAEIKAKTPVFRKRLETLKASGAHIDYALSKLSIIEAFLPNAEKKIPNPNYQLACTAMLDEMQQLANLLQSDLEALSSDPKGVPQVYRYRTGPIIPSGYSQIANVMDPKTGKVIRRPSILNGFGHFFTVADEIPFWQDRGCDFIQIELGPNCVSPRPDGTLQVDESAVINIVKYLQNAVKYNVAVTLLISPHYVPNSSGGMYWSDLPSVWAYYNAYLSAILPKIKNIPSLHSITLSNEPHSFSVPTDPYLQKTWLEYISKKYRGVSKLNAAYGGKSFASFSDVPMPPADKVWPGSFTHDERPWIYDWERCNEERFAAWHKRMADLVHKYAPSVSVHTKITGGFLTGGPMADGIDPELYASFTNYCGFDEVGGLRIIYDLDTSFQKAPIINSENHILSPDITYDMLDMQRFYSDIYTQAMHGQTASATWTYEPYFYDGLEKTTFAIRPAAMASVAKCGMDLMRIAPEMSAIQNASRKVAIIYSPVSYWYNSAYHPTWYSAWDAFFNTGLRVRFLSEKQLQAGKFGDVKVLILPEAQVVEPETIAGIRKFVANGGKVISIGHNLEYTPGWLPINAESVKHLLWKRIDIVGIGWQKQVVSWVRKAGVSPNVTLASSTNKDLTGIHWLSGIMNGKKVVSIVNISGKPVDLSISSPNVIGAWDMIADKKIELPIKLQNYGTMMIRLKTK